MKHLLIPLLIAFSTMAQAQKVYRCESSPSHFIFQDQQCVVPAQKMRVSLPQSGQRLIDASESEDANFGPIQRTEVIADGDDLDGSSREQRRQKHLQRQRDTSMPPQEFRKQDQYAANRARCQTALQVATMCGKYAGRFSCGERGFRLATPIGVDGTAIGPAEIFKMDRCALQAANGRS